MHPGARFHWQDREAMLSFIADISFCTIFICGESGPMLVHAPVIVEGKDRLRFHLSRAIRATPALDAGHALLSCLGPDAYISPDWYGTPDQVPTWNYLAVEAEGPLRRLDETELAAQLDALSARHEARLAPKPPWTRGKMKPGLFETMLNGITGFEMRVEALRGTRKLGQNKQREEREGTLAGLERNGRADMAAIMRAVSVR
jgi:transcriptional regulator